MCGSSPLTRGKRRGRRYREAHGGLIPAHAGKTSPTWSLPTTMRAHPRSRGENRGRAAVSTRAPGSSPLTRGKLREDIQAQRTDRLIPAHAGKTSEGLGSASASRAHPRSRGENLYGVGEAGGYPGSSPLTRGKPVDVADLLDHRRLIPAHAGKTSPLPTTRPSPTAHPRSRGENRDDRELEVKRGGSSPLTRGKLRYWHRPSLPARLIPAHAGKTCGKALDHFRAWAHPRSRGENPC